MFHNLVPMILELESQMSMDISVICDLAVVTTNANMKAADMCKEHRRRLKEVMSMHVVDVSYKTNFNTKL